MIAQAGGGLEGRRPLERGQPPACQAARLLQLIAAADGGERGVDQGRGDAAGAQLGAQASGAVAAGGAGGDPLAGERGVVDMAAALEVGGDVGGDLRRRAAAAEAGRELGPCPRAARQQITRGEPGGLEVEDPPRRWDGATT
ncbi:MAG TPA: hypothetical protein VMQ51_18735 [Candidatus Binatia bacterium]|nr:hypothetical protein [Candidatus Binatia bacterium]